MYKKLEHEEETDDLVKINLWEITESQRKAVDNTFCQTEDSNLGHVRVYSLQSLKQNQWLNSEVMDVIFYYMAATRSDTVSFCDEARGVRISSEKSNLKDIIQQ